MEILFICSEEDEETRLTGKKRKVYYIANS